MEEQAKCVVRMNERPGIRTLSGIPDGGPAYPVDQTGGPRTPGISVRAVLALAALPGILREALDNPVAAASLDYATPEDEAVRRMKPIIFRTVRLAYLVADAGLAARQAREPVPFDPAVDIRTDPPTGQNGSPVPLKRFPDVCGEIAESHNPETAVCQLVVGHTGKHVYTRPSGCTTVETDCMTPAGRLPAAAVR